MAMMNKKKIFLSVFLLIVIALGAVGAKKILDRKKNLAEQKIVKQMENLPSLAKDPQKRKSSEELMLDSKGAQNCGECKLISDCEQVLNCMKTNSATCKPAIAKITYPISNTGNNRVLTYLILGLNTDKCELEGIMNNETDVANAPSRMRFDCQVDQENIANLFEQQNPSSFLIQNCFGDYVTFLQNRRAQNAQNSSANGQ